MCQIPQNPPLPQINPHMAANKNAALEILQSIYQELAAKAATEVTKVTREK